MPLTQGVYKEEILPLSGLEQDEVWQLSEYGEAGEAGSPCFCKKWNRDSRK